MDCSFQNWVSYYGTERLANKLGITVAAVNYWKYRRGWPKVAFIIEILKLSKGKLTFESIVNSTSPRSR